MLNLNESEYIAVEVAEFVAIPHYLHRNVALDFLAECANRIIALRTAECAEVSAKHYEVIVGNIGTVYIGTDYTEADATTAEYVDQSTGNYGRAAGEPVTMRT